MGQFSEYVGRTLRPPRRVQRVFNVVMPIIMVIRALVTRRLEDILTALFFVVLLFPLGVAPKWFAARLAALGDRPVLNAVLSFLLMSCATFLLLRWFLDRTPSALIALLIAAVATVLSLRRNRGRRTT